MYIYIYIYIYTRRKDGAKAPSLLDHFGRFVAKYLGHSSWASAYELLWLWFRIEFSSFGSKAQILALRFPISHAKAHVSLK